MFGFIHDQGLLAWFVVAGYVIAALLAVRAGSAAGGRERSLWRGIALTLLLLGINKQLDLQSDLTDIARAAAHSEGWYGWRRDVQGVFLLLMAIGTIAVAMLLWRGLRKATASAKVAAMGLLILLAFIFLRAASFHHIDYWVTIPIAGMRSGWWLELLGIAVIGSAAACRGRVKRLTASRS
ncbi:MAG: hypothetical protein ABI454_09110 [Sphingomicrobium sp.]